MSRAHMLVTDERSDVPQAAQWWTLELRDGEVVHVQINDIESPTVATYTFDDGDDAEIAPAAIRTRHEPDRANLGRDYLRPVPDRVYLDVLIEGRPTASPRWHELTSPGVHWHPSNGQPPHDIWAADTIRKSTVFRRGLRANRAAR